MQSISPTATHLGNCCVTALFIPKEARGLRSGADRRRHSAKRA